jgi:hypothetical protein
MAAVSEFQVRQLRDGIVEIIGATSIKTKAQEITNSSPPDLTVTQRLKEEKDRLQKDLNKAVEMAYRYLMEEGESLANLKQNTDTDDLNSDHREGRSLDHVAASLGKPLGKPFESLWVSLPCGHKQSLSPSLADLVLLSRGGEYSSRKSFR